MTEQLIIIGSGPAGLTAAIYAARAHLKPLVIEGDKPGGQLMGTSYVENWPGEIRIEGPQLMEKMRNQAAHLGTRFLAETVTGVDLSARPFKIMTKHKTLSTHALIIATGATPKKLCCPGEETFWGKGVSTCTVCDGVFYSNKRVVIVGGGDSAMESASFMLNFTDKITIVHILPALTASPAMQERVLNNPHITILYEHKVTAIEGEHGKVKKVVVASTKTGTQTILEADGVFIAIGLTPNTALFKGQLEFTPYGYIVLKNHTETSVPGVFAAGDVADSVYRQAVTSAGTGCMATLDAVRYLKERIKV